MTTLQAILATGIAFCLAELIKMVYLFSTERKFRIFPIGGVISSHTTSVAALAMAVFYETGFSLLFLACVVFGLIVMRDAIGVRWEVSRHSQALNKLTKKNDYEVTGHTKLQTFAGIAFAIAVVMIFYLF